MSRLQLHTVETAPEASRPYLQKALDNNGFLPNLVASLANAPVALETYLKVGEINGRSGLTLAERVNCANAELGSFLLGSHDGERFGRFVARHAFDDTANGVADFKVVDGPQTNFLTTIAGDFAFRHQY